MFHAFRLTLSAAGGWAENLENRSWGKNIEEKAKSPHAETAYRVRGLSLVVHKSHKVSPSSR
jgi:hypothetical protein